MFLRADDRSPAPLAIAQTSHAWMAFQLASHWGNRRFRRPSPRAEVLAAVLLHDAGWTDFDLGPGVDEDGRPLTFDRMPVTEHLAIWEGCVTRSALYSRYAALLVASHVQGLAHRKEGDAASRGDSRLLATVRDWRRALAARQESWRLTLAVDPRYARCLAGPAWEANRALLAACDAVSVHLCADIPGPFTVAAADRGGAPQEVSFEPLGGDVWKVRPWPLQGRRLDLQCEGRRLPAPRFAGAEALRLALAAAIGERRSFALVSPSRSGSG